MTHPPALDSALLAGRPRSPDRFEYVLYLNSLDLRAGEERMIEHALALTNGNRTKAAKLLGINVRTLRRKLKHVPKPPLASDPELEFAREVKAELEKRWRWDNLVVPRSA